MQNTHVPENTIIGQTLSIRGFASLIGVGHNTLSAWIQQLETELAQEIGTKQGQGKPTLLTAEDQALIIQKKGIILSPAKVPLIDSTGNDVAHAEPEGTPTTLVLAPSPGTLATIQQGNKQITRPLGAGKDSSAMTVMPEGVEVTLYTPEVLNINLGDVSDAADGLQADIAEMLKQFSGNQELVKQALLKQFQQQGIGLGVQLAAAEISSALQQAETAKVQMLQQLGILPTPTIETKEDNTPQKPVTGAE